MAVFALVWFGQLVSLTGSGLTEFALGVWVFQRTGSPVQFALTVLFVSLPRILLSPLAGTLVDRWDRRLAMLLSDLGSGLCTLAVALLLFANRLQIGHVYLLVAISSAFGTFQRPTRRRRHSSFHRSSMAGRMGWWDWPARSLRSSRRHWQVSSS
jgi:MFS family permease